MLRKTRTKNFNNFIKEDYFFRILSFVKNNSYKENILQLISKYDNFYENIEWIKIILSLNGITDWEYLDLDWERISTHKDLTGDLILEHIDKPWDFWELSEHPNFNIEWIREFPEEDWNYYELSKHPNFNIKWLREFPDKNWNYYKLSSRPNFNIEWIRDFPEKNWNYYQLSKHPEFTLNWVFECPNENWNWFKIFSDTKFKNHFNKLFIPSELYLLYNKFFPNNEILTKVTLLNNFLQYNHKVIIFKKLISLAYNRFWDCFIQSSILWYNIEPYTILRRMNYKYYYYQIIEKIKIFEYEKKRKKFEMSIMSLIEFDNIFIYRPIRPKFQKYNFYESVLNELKKEPKKKYDKKYDKKYFLKQKNDLKISYKKNLRFNNFHKYCR